MGVENNIPEGWMETTLGDLVERITKGTTPKTFSSEKNDVNYIKSDALNYSGFLDNGRFVKISNETNNKLKRSQLKVDDILLSMAGEKLGKTGIIKEQHLPANTNQAVAIITVNKKRVGYKFIWYKLRNKNTVKYFKTIPSQSAQPNINFQEIRSLPINLPTLPEQKSIAKVLTAFDDKIELLQSQNKTLETMAQTIFIEWFGKYQIGDELPEGWRVGEFGEVIEFINGYAFKSKDLSKEPIDNAYKVFKMGDINKGGGFKPGKTKGYYPKSMSTKLNKYILKNGDLLMSMTDMKDAISLLGHTALMIYEDEYIVNQRVGLIRVKNDLNIEYPYLYLLTNNDDFIAGIRAGANSGVQVNLSTQGIKETEFIIADKETNKAFNNVVMPLFEKRKANSQMIKELKKTRDTLLPKLMSGQVRVKNINQTTDA